MAQQNSNDSNLALGYAKQAQMEAADARSLARTATFMSAVAIAIALVALLWR